MAFLSKRVFTRKYLNKGRHGKERSNNLQRSLHCEGLEGRRMLATIFSEGFEGSFPAANWYVGNNTPNTVAKWGDNSAKANTGNWSAFAADNGSDSRATYDNDLNTYMPRRNISLVGYETATLSFKYWLNSEFDWDFFEVNVKDQFGNWSNLLSESGDVSSWRTETIDLSSYAGQSGVTIGFDFVSDESIVPSGSAGVWVDDVVLTAESFTPYFFDARVTNRVDQDGDGYARQLDIEFDVDSNVAGSYYVKLYEDDILFDDFLLTSPTWSVNGTAPDYHGVTLSSDTYGWSHGTVEFKLELYDAVTNSLKQTRTADDDPSLGNVDVELSVEDAMVTALSWRDALGNVISSANAGATVYLRADALGMAGQTINISIWEDDGIGDDLIVTKAITIGSSGYGAVEWTASWQSLDADDPQNMYYLYYADDGVYSGVSNTGHFYIGPTPWSASANEYRTWLSRDWEGSPDSPEGEIELRIDRRFEDGANIISSLPTVVVIHGWTDHFYPREVDDDTSMYDLAEAAYYSADSLGMQLLTLDWHEGASRTGVDDGSAELWIPVVAEAAAAAFEVMGFLPANVNLLGHSYGAVLAGELASRTLGGVNTIIALDPANNHPLGGGGYDTESVDFAANSNYSWAFLTSLYGSGDTVPTADAAFMVDILGDSFAGFDSHSHAKTLYEEILRRNNDGTAGLFSRMFDLQDVLAHSAPWVLNHVIVNALTGSWSFTGDGSGSYEAVLHFQASEDDSTVTPLSVEFVSGGGSLVEILETAQFPTVVRHEIADGLQQRAVVTSLSVQFSENVILSTNVLALHNETTGLDVASSDIVQGYDAVTHSATFTFPGLADGKLPEGRYIATVLAGGVGDTGGTPMQQDYVFSFHVLEGDLTGDGDVDRGDVARLLNYFGSTDGAVVGDGDLDGDGRVGVRDLVLLQRNYNWPLLSPAAADVVLARAVGRERITESALNLRRGIGGLVAARSTRGQATRVARITDGLPRSDATETFLRAIRSVVRSGRGSGTIDEERAEF